MSLQTVSTPRRPKNVPAGAEWSEDDREWVLAERDEDGELQGLVRYYRPNGTLCCETEHVDGTPHGSYRRFHETGEVARQGTFVDGTLHGTDLYFRTDGETSETFPDGLADVIWRCEMDFDDGDIVEGRLFDRDGRRVMEDGEPFPETRPKGVAKDAHFRKSEALERYVWVSGKTEEDDGEIQRIGTWRFWSPEGVLIREEPYEDGEIHGSLKIYDDESGTLVATERYEAGERRFDRPSGVPETATFDPDPEIWTEEACADGDARAWRADGTLVRVETYRNGDIHRVREYLNDGSLAEDATYRDGGVPQRRWLRRSPTQALRSFPRGLLREHPEAHEVEYTFDRHGFMTDFRVRDASRQEIAHEEVYKNAVGDRDQTRVASVDEASKAWIHEGTRYTRELNAWLAAMYASGGETDVAEPTFDRPDLERAVLEGIESLNASGMGRRAHERFPLFYDGIGKAFWDRYGLVIDRVLEIGERIYARVVPPVGAPYVARLKDGELARHDNVLAFGASPDKRFAAFAYDDKIVVQGKGSRLELRYPTRYGHEEADALRPKKLGRGSTMVVRDVRVCPGGKEVLLVSAEGIYAVKAAGVTRLYPLDATLDEYIEHYPEGDGEGFALDMRFPNADVSPSGELITCGGMFRRGIMAGLAIYENRKLKSTSQDDAFFPMQAVFHRDRPHVAFAACLYASLGHAMTNTTFRIDLDDLEEGDLDGFGGGIAQEPGVVNTIASFGDGFLLGFDNGYVRWMGVEENCQLKGYLYVGGSIRHIDVSADQRGFTTVSEAGIVSRFRLGNAASPNLVTTLPVVDVARTAFFRTFPPLSW